MLQSCKTTFQKLTASIKPKGGVSLTRTPTLATIEFDSKATKNALAPSMMLDLTSIVEELASHPPPFLIITGKNGTFCSGADIGVAASTLMSPEGGEAMTNLMREVTDTLKELPSVSFAAIDGAAYGGGAELATCCDFRVLTDTAKIRFVQAQMGVTCGWGGARRLRNIVGEKEALRLMLFREVVTPPRGLQNGLVDWAAPPTPTHSAADFVKLTLIDQLQDLDSDIVKALKPSLQKNDEASVFIKHWGGEPHVAAFSRALNRNK